MRLRNIVVVVAVCLISAGTMQGGTITDNFSGYAVGTFPSPTWQDVGTVLPGPGQPVPSALVVSTTDAFGNPIQALGLVDQVSYSRGIYATTPVSSNYTLSADIRIDQYSNAPSAPSSDWAMQLTFAEAGVDNFAFTPQAGIYASSLTGDWRLFLIGGAGGPDADIDLGVPANIGTWYQVQLNFDSLDATFQSKITNILTGTVLVDQTNTIAGLTPAEAAYNSIAFFGGETSPGSTVADQAVVTNINTSATGTVPEPPTALLIAIAVGFVALGQFRRALAQRC